MNTLATKTAVSEYQQSAIDFLNNTNTQLTITYKKCGKHFDDDKEDRDIYSCTLTRGRRSYTFDFGNSIVNSRYKIATRSFSRNELKGCLDKDGRVNHTLFCNKYFPLSPAEKAAISRPSAPEEYSILSCLTKYDPGTFEDFCSEFGYDTDSRKAEKIYKAVKDEYLNLASLFTEAEMNQLAEIN